MDKVIVLLVLSVLSQPVVPDVPTETSFRANIELVSEYPRVFSGERVQLRCSIPDGHRSTWSYLWFRGSEQLSQFEEELVLWNTNVKESGKYYCQGLRQTRVGKIHTQQSLPVEIMVDGGFAILQVPHHGLVGHTLKMTCRVRGNRPIHERILYKDGTEVMRQNDQNPHFYLTSLSLEDQGMYSCRASWDVRRQTYSVISAPAHVQVFEVLSQPRLEIESNDAIWKNKMKLICRVQYNAPAPAPPVDYYFYRNGQRLGPATSENYELVSQAPGLYSCRTKVPKLGLEKWSEPNRFGQLAVEPMTTAPVRPHPSVQRPIPHTVSSPDHSLLPEVLPNASQLSSHQFQRPHVSIQHLEESTPSQRPPLKTSEAVQHTTVQFFNPATGAANMPPGAPPKPLQTDPTILPNTVQFFNPPTTYSNIFREPDSASEGSGDMRKESDN